MGLFGSAKKSSFETKPDPRVASMLKDILHEANDMDSFEFIQHQAAQLNPEQQQAIQNLAQSGNLRAVAGALSPRLAQGIDQATALNKVYSDAADSAVNPNDVIKNAESLRTGLAATARIGFPILSIITGKT